MRTTRKNVLIGLGLIIAIGGAVIGSGAFSTVQADRGVSVETAGDADAYLAITPGDGYGDSGYISDDSNGVMTFDLGDPGNDTTAGGKGFNQNGTTTITGLIQLENQGNDGPITVGFDDQENPNDTTTVMLDEGEVTLTIEDSEPLSTGDTANVTVTVDTSVDTSNEPQSTDVTIYATE